MSFAVIQTGGKQYKVSASEILKIERLENPEGKTIEFKNVLFLNDDTKVLDRDWLNRLVSICGQDDVGAVGPKLIYSNNTIQHAGSVILETGASFHPFQNIENISNLHFNFLNIKSTEDKMDLK